MNRLARTEPLISRTPAPGPGVPTRNRVLQRLPPQDRVRLLATLQPVTFALGDVIAEPGRRMDYLYFPTTAVISSLYTTQEGATAEMGLAGRDGVVGVSLFLGGDAATNQDVVVVAGDAFRLKAQTLREEFAAGGALQALLLQYTQALITQISQTAVCNRLHPVEQRLCRWLLMCHDRVESDDLQMTQEFISNMLGGRRETVTVAAGRLQDAGLIRYSRGHITIVDRHGLEAAACECYPAVAAWCRRLAAG
ncbi:MAG: Crp/Fnr family transcriptional regulator [Acidobacteriota bacterium]